MRRYNSKQAGYHFHLLIKVKSNRRGSASGYAGLPSRCAKNFTITPSPERVDLGPPDP
jgi:hypothetical protein